MSPATPEPTPRSGFVSIVGRPNSGKSTLLNRLVGDKISIVTSRPQTTRNVVRGILNDSRGQIVFLDTPGMHIPKDELNKYMVAQARKALEDADVSVVMVEAPNAFGAGDKYLARWLREEDAPAILAVNKIDLVKPGKLREITQETPEKDFWQDEFYISSLHGLGVKELLASLKKRMPVGPRLFPRETLTDRNERYIVSELIRESVFKLTRDEIPHSTAVVVDEFKEGDVCHIQATIFVEADSQKGIIVGKGGQMIKNIGTSARTEIETMLGCKVFLQLFVKVRKRWRKKSRDLEEFGYHE